MARTAIYDVIWDAIIDASVLYLHRVDARLDEVFAARLALEQLVAGLASERLDEADLDAEGACERTEPFILLGMHMTGRSETPEFALLNHKEIPSRIGGRHLEIYPAPIE